MELAFAEMKPLQARSEIRPGSESINPFFCKLRQVVDLSKGDEDLLDRLLAPALSFPPHHLLAQQGSLPKDINLIVQGIACLQKTLYDGREIISGLLLPGDLCCTSVEVSRRATHAVVTLTRCSVIKINQETFDRIEKELPHLVRGLWRLALADQSIAREWFVNAAGRPAITRMAHFFCEILARLQAVGLAKDGAYPLALTQAELAGILGISSVHVNRTLQELRATNLLKFANKGLEIPDIGKLQEFCQFSPDYLLLRAV